MEFLLNPEPIDLEVVKMIRTDQPIKFSPDCIAQNVKEVRESLN